MTCHFIISEDGAQITICTNNFIDDRCELKKAMVCRRREVCEECDSHRTCQGVLARRKEREHANEKTKL